MQPSLFSFKRSLDVSLPPQQPLIDISNIELDFKKKNIELYFRKYSRYIGYSFKLFEPIYNTLLAEVRVAEAKFYFRGVNMITNVFCKGQ